MTRDLAGPAGPGLLRCLGAAALACGLGLACTRLDTQSSLPDEEAPLHLEQHLSRADVEGSAVPVDIPKPIEWRFDRPQPSWQPVGYAAPDERLPRITYLDDAVRIRLSDEEPVAGWRKRHGGLMTEVPAWNLDDWAYVIVRLRTSDPVDHLELGLNLREVATEQGGPFETYSAELPVIHDGTVQSYVARTDRLWSSPLAGTVEELALYVGAVEPVTVDLLSATAVPREADYAAAGAGVKMESRSGEHRRTIFTHVPARLEYRVRVPRAGRLDFALGVLRDDVPVTFAVSARADGDPWRSLFEETHADRQRWAQRSVDLSSLAGKEVALSFETAADRAGTVALWATPILSGERRTARPNVILYIIDGAGADFMSVYGYNRPTTPNLERLAAQGALFERAYSNSTWSKPSTASFMTSLHHSVLGGHRGDSDRVPEGAVTMAQHLHAAGYQTAVLVSNPFAATLSNLERGVDFLQETGIEPNNSESSRLLHEAFWRWREGHPAQPYWVHFQTTDIHEPFDPVPPFSGIYVDPALREAYEEWDRQLNPGLWREPAGYDRLGIDRLRYAHAQQGLYDEAMAHNDHRIGELVARLKQRGEWDHTLLIIGADHGYPAASHRLMEPLAPEWGPMFNSHETRIPLIFVWPGRIGAGQRFPDPVSMIDVLPTILNLLELPIPEITQGRSLAPLLLGEGHWKPRPVIFDEFAVDDETGELRGLIEVVDGRWGASLEIGEGAANDIGVVGAETPDEHRPAPLLLYDLWNDPYTLRSLHEERPDLVEKYTRLLQRRWASHRELAQRLGQGGQVSVTAAQLEALRALGYLD